MESMDYWTSLLTFLQGGDPEIQGWPSHPQGLTCARGEANKVVAAAAQAAPAAAPPLARQPRPQRISVHGHVAVHPSEVLHQCGIAMHGQRDTGSLDSYRGASYR